jgi:hypothetical protein
MEPAAAYISARGSAMKFEAFKSKDGKFRWHVRDSNGQIVPVRAGKVKLPPVSREEAQRVRSATDKVLRRIADQEAKQAKA